MIGKSATKVAQKTRERVVSLTQMIIRGATATIGVTWSKTAYGNKAFSKVRLWINMKDIKTPIKTAKQNDKKVISRVTFNAEPNKFQSVTRVFNTSMGLGSK